MRFTPVLIAAAVGYLAMQDGALAGGNREASDCGDPAILKTVAKRFHHQSHEVHHDRLTIDAGKTRNRIDLVAPAPLLSGQGTAPDCTALLRRDGGFVGRAQADAVVFHRDPCGVCRLG